MPASRAPSGETRYAVGCRETACEPLCPHHGRATLNNSSCGRDTRDVKSRLRGLLSNGGVHRPYDDILNVDPQRVRVIFKLIMWTSAPSVPYTYVTPHATELGCAYTSYPCRRRLPLQLTGGACPSSLHPKSSRRPAFSISSPSLAAVLRLASNYCRSTQESARR